MMEWVFHVSILPYCLFTCVKLDLSDCLPFTCVFCHRQMMDPSWKNQDLVLRLPLVRNRLLLEHWIGLEGTNEHLILQLCPMLNSLTMWTLLTVFSSHYTLCQRCKLYVASMEVCSLVKVAMFQAWCCSQPLLRSRAFWPVCCICSSGWCSSWSNLF